MTGPVFVIHGVGTRNRQAFEDRIARLGEVTGRRHEMRPVYWGDLGADDQWVNLTIPSPGELGGPEAADSSGIRDGVAPPRGITGLTADLAGALLAGFPVAAEPMLRNSVSLGGAGLAAAGAARRMGPPPDDTADIRDGDAAGPVQTAAVTEAIIEHWESTTWLRQVTDPLLLDEIGVAIGAAVADPDAAAEPPGEELRGGGDPGHRCRWLRQATRGRLGPRGWCHHRRRRWRLNAYHLASEDLAHSRCGRSRRGGR